MTNSKFRLYATICCIGLGVGLAGCGGSEIKGVDPNLVSVKGKVTYDGKPLKSGDISFVSVDNPSKGYASAIDAQGNYSLAYSPSARGALPGAYNVRIAALDGVPTMGDKGELTQPKSLIPVKYNDPALSGLKANVEKGKSNVFNFDLKPE